MPDNNLNPENIEDAAADVLGAAEDAAANVAADAAGAVEGAVADATNAATAVPEAVANAAASVPETAGNALDQLANALSGDAPTEVAPVVPVEGSATPTQPFSDPNSQVSPFDNGTATPEVRTDMAEPAVVADATAQMPQAVPAAVAQPDYTQPTQVIDPAAQAAGAQTGYTQPAQAYDPNQAYQQQPYGAADPNQQPYGAPQYGQPVAPQYYQNGSNPGTTPMVLGILSIVFAGLIGLILSIIGLKKSGPVLAADPTNGRAKAGKITSIIGLILSILAFILSIFMMIGLVYAANEVAENPDAFIESMEEIAALDETGELQSEIDELKQELGSTTESSSSSAAGAASGAASSTSGLERDNAVAKAKDYLSYMPFSHDGLVSQLEYDKFSHEDAVYAADSCGADWNEEALKMAQEYLEYTPFSEAGLIDQLEFEEFTSEQATYGVQNCGADWNEQAEKMAQEYLEYSSYSRDGLVEQLVYEGFSQEQAEYGVSKTGL